MMSQLIFDFLLHFFSSSHISLKYEIWFFFRSILQEWISCYLLSLPLLYFVWNFTTALYAILFFSIFNHSLQYSTLALFHQIIFHSFYFQFCYFLFFWLIFTVFLPNFFIKFFFTFIFLFSSSFFFLMFSIFLFSYLFLFS